MSVSFIRTSFIRKFSAHEFRPISWIFDIADVTSVQNRSRNLLSMNPLQKTETYRVVWKIPFWHESEYLFVIKWTVFTEDCENVCTRMNFFYSFHIYHHLLRKSNICSETNKFHIVWVHSIDNRSDLPTVERE